MLLNFFLKNCHATLSYCVQSHSKFSVTIYQNKIFVFAVALTDTQAKIHLKHCLHQCILCFNCCQSMERRHTFSRAVLPYSQKQHYI